MLPSIGILGARLFQPRPCSASFGWIARVGMRFSTSIKELVKERGSSLIFLGESQSPSIKGCLKYVDTAFGRRGNHLRKVCSEADCWLPKHFEYLTPMLNTSPCHLGGTKLLSSLGFHFLRDPVEITVQVTDLLELKSEAGIKDRPLIVWEPRPPSCIPENRDALFETVKYVEVFSPNHTELGAIFNHTALACKEES